MVAVIIASFNRPRSLAEALHSVRGAGQIIIADDGSDFDVRPYATGVTEIVSNPPIPPGERLGAARVGALLNRALQKVRQPIVTYLNDDDLFASDWLRAVGEFFDAHPGVHICRGDWLHLGSLRNVFSPSDPWCLTTGNFAYRTECAHVERCLWNERTVGASDAQMLYTYLNQHGIPPGGWTVPHIGAQAGWRREHKSNMTHHTVAGGYQDSAEAMFALGSRE